MVNKLILWAAENKKLERIVSGNRMTAKTVQRFVAGAQLTDAINAAVDLNSHGISGILDLLGEGVTDLAGAATATAQYRHAITQIADRGIDASVSLKLSQLGLLVDKDACLANLLQVLEYAADLGVRVEVDMEQSEIVDATLQVFTQVTDAHPDTRLAMQACLHRTPADLESMASAKPRVRLVKGAYAEPAQRALQSRSAVLEQYRMLTNWLFDKGVDPAFGTHDDECIDYAKQAAAAAGKDKCDFEFQMLYGIRRDLQHSLVQDGYRVRVYIPFGSAWYPYLMRRMAERPANLLFFLRSLVGK